MSDAEARAMYFNNLGAEALIAGDLATAYGHIRRAIAVDPSMSDAWSNLGVLLRHNGQPDDAETAYRRTLELEPRELAAMGNLHDLYVAAGRMEEAAKLQRRVERYRRENPYYLLFLGEEALAAGDLVQAEDLLRQALRRKEDEHRLHFALAQVLYRSGRRQAAASSLARARELAPPEILRAYQRPLEELAHGASDPVLLSR
jgi:Flp pilus assembly protein TadD